VVQWTARGIAICTATNLQYEPKIVSDGAGGAILTWRDSRNGSNLDIYAQRINATGMVQWTANGIAICIAIRDQYVDEIVSDGAGGAIITWLDNPNGSNLDIYAQRINAGGVVQWTADGVAICTSIRHQFVPQIVSYGSGGAIITWFDYRSGSNFDIYAQRINATGAVQWTANGVAICTSIRDQHGPQIVSDGAEGAIITWETNATDSSTEIFMPSGSMQPGWYNGRQTG
jgi:hypothetical protein